MREHLFFFFMQSSKQGNCHLGGFRWLPEVYHHAPHDARHSADAYSIPFDNSLKNKAALGSTCDENKCPFTVGVSIVPYRVAQKKVDTCVLQTLTSHKSHFFLIFDGKTYINGKVIHERVYFSVCPP